MKKNIGYFYYFLTLFTCSVSYVLASQQSTHMNMGGENENAQNSNEIVNQIVFGNPLPFVEGVEELKNQTNIASNVLKKLKIKNKFKKSTEVSKNNNKNDNEEASWFWQRPGFITTLGTTVTYGLWAYSKLRGQHSQFKQEQEETLRQIKEEYQKAKDAVENYKVPKIKVKEVITIPETKIYEDVRYKNKRAFNTFGEVFTQSVWDVVSLQFVYKLPTAVGLKAFEVHEDFLNSMHDSKPLLGKKLPKVNAFRGASDDYVLKNSSFAGNKKVPITESVTKTELVEKTIIVEKDKPGWEQDYDLLRDKVMKYSLASNNLMQKTFRINPKDLIPESIQKKMGTTSTVWGLIELLINKKHIRKRLWRWFKGLFKVPKGVGKNVKESIDDLLSVKEATQVGLLSSLSGLAVTQAVRATNPWSTIAINGNAFVMGALPAAYIGKQLAKVGVDQLNYFVMDKKLLKWYLEKMDTVGQLSWIILYEEEREEFKKAMQELGKMQTELVEAFGKFYSQKRTKDTHNTFNYELSNVRIAIFQSIFKLKGVLVSKLNKVTETSPNNSEGIQALEEQIAYLENLNRDMFMVIPRGIFDYPINKLKENIHKKIGPINRNSKKVGYIGSSIGVGIWAFLCFYEVRGLENKSLVSYALANPNVIFNGINTMAVASIFAAFGFLIFGSKIGMLFGAILGFFFKRRTKKEKTNKMTSQEDGSVVGQLTNFVKNNIAQPVREIVMGKQELTKKPSSNSRSKLWVIGFLAIFALLFGFLKSKNSKRRKKRK